ncbi:hypothetical protein CSUB01_10305 [Colletotrichum sublineola]|uniref:PPPDE domain-containing protein n=1 Tax=Colletotrichum sublineola TaxID=1173701 RepID=A0A066XZ36_COLSU|nr:hypothetical protein CSUB01_10305 [Colletotrichum sublineola]
MPHLLAEMGCVEFGLQNEESFEAALRREFQNLVDEGYRKRLEIESRTDRGERIWLSHNGIFYHWVIITHGFKYEIRRGNNNGASKLKQWMIKIGLGDEYYLSIEPATVSEERRQMAITDHHEPIVGEHFLSMIGWTSKSRQEVDAAGRAVEKEFGTYSYVYNNCQDFLRRFAKKIITQKADDWKWFFEGALSRYRYEPVTTPVELAILAKVSLESMKSLRGTVMGQDAIILERNISRIERYINEQEISFVAERSGLDGDRRKAAVDRRQIQHRGSVDFDSSGHVGGGYDEW